MRDQGENPDTRMFWAAGAHGRTNEEFKDYTRGLSAGLKQPR